MVINKLIVGIFTDDSTYDRKNAVYSTWYMDLLQNKIRSFFILSDSKYNKMGDKINQYEILLRCQERYEQLVNKTYNFLKYIDLTYYDYEYIFKCDDDTFIDVNTFKNINLDGCDYAGVFTTTPDEKNVDDEFLKKWQTLHWNKCSSEYHVKKHVHFNLTYAYGGAGYFLSKKAVKHILSYDESEFKNTPQTYIGEDVKIGLCLQDYKFKKLNLKEYIEFDKDIDVMKNGATFHPISSNNMNTFHKMSYNERIDFLKR